MNDFKPFFSVKMFFYQSEMQRLTLLTGVIRVNGPRSFSCDKKPDNISINSPGCNQTIYNYLIWPPPSGNSVSTAPQHFITPSLWQHGNKRLQEKIFITQRDQFVVVVQLWHHCSFQDKPPSPACSCYICRNFGSMRCHDKLELVVMSSA